MNKKLLALLGGYVAGMAFWSKKRQSEGTSKLKKPLLESTISEIIDEIIDMHTLAYDEVKKRVEPIFEEISDFDSLKAHVDEMIDGFEEKWEKTFSNIKEMTVEKKQELSEKFDNSKDHLEKTLDTAKERAGDFKDTTQKTVEKWSKEAQSKVQDFYKKAQSYFDSKK
ncbi:hypothetical protein CSB09_01960 [Candidatus Gracilibacteria bacterium]|nr:MAG: hypothetical protein CSB09_01960 [Candidatus Gracilibacteria bacterium]